MRSRPCLRALALLAPLPLLACKPTASPLQALPPPPAADPSPPAATPAAELPPPPPPVVYGHIRVPSATTVLAQLRASALPAERRALFDESTLRQIAVAMLDERRALAERVDLTRPMGCVFVSPQRYDLPLACVIAYQGGLATLVDDLGPSGYVSGASDYAHYRFEGRAVYLAAMGDHVAFAFAPDLIAATRDRLQRDVIEAPAGAEDLQAAIHPGVIFEDAEDEVLAFIDQVGRNQASATDTEVSKAAQRQQWMSWGELERADLWLDLDEGHVRLGYRGTARPGTATERGYAGTREPVDAEPLLQQLPADSLALMAMRMDVRSLLEDPMFGATAQVVASIDATGTDAAMAEHHRRANALWQEMATGGAAAALMHEPGTNGGFLIAYRLRPDVDAVAKLRELFDGYRESPDIAQLVDVRVRPKSLRMGKIRGDSATVTPTATLRARPVWSGVEQVFGKNAALHLAYAQRRDVLFIAMTTAKADRYLARALAAADGKRSLADRKDAASLLETHADDTLMATASFAAIARWLQKIGAIEPLPFTTDEHLDDLLISMQPGGERQRELVIDLSPNLVDALFRLGG